MSSKTKTYEVENLRFGEFLIIIEFCSKCKNHNNSLRHIETKYLQKAINLKSLIQKEFPFMKIYLKPLQEDQSKNLKKLGLFEIYFADYENKELFLLGSKLKTLKWPKSKIVINNIRDRFLGKILDIKLEKNFSNFFHPENKMRNEEIKTIFCSSLDFPEILKNVLKKKKNRKSKTAKFDFTKKSRKLSSIVKSKIETGVIKKSEIDNLLINKKIENIQILDKKNNLRFKNVKPGNYKLIILENKNIKYSLHDIKITPFLRQKDSLQKKIFSLNFKEESFCEFFLEYKKENPIIKFCFKKKIEGDFSQMEEDVIFKKNFVEDKKNFSVFEIEDVFSGFYEIFVEYKDYQIFRNFVYIFKGFNFYKISFPDFEMNYDYQKDGSFLNKIKNLNMPVIFEKPKIKDNFCSPIKEKNEDMYNNYENKENLQEKTKRSSNQNISNQKTDLQNKKCSKQNINKINSNPNLEKNSFKSEQDHINTQNNPLNNPNSKTPETLFKSSNEESYKQNKIENNQNITKIEKEEKNQIYNTKKNQRVASGNRIRPGERLYSAKSNNLTHPITDENKKSSQFITHHNFHKFEDGIWENFEKDEKNINLFIKINKCVETQMDFFLDGEEEIDQNNVIFQDCVDNYEKLILKYVKEIKLGRIFVQVKNQINENFDVYIGFGDFVSKIDLSGFLTKFLNPKEKFCDLCIITNDIQQSKFKLDTFLVPMEKEISCITGLFEIKNLVNFVKNSKFPVSKFFGFEENFEDEKTEEKDYTINIKEAIDSLQNYELYCESVYILNSIRYEKSDNLSLRNLEEIYPKWENMILNCKELIEQLENAEEGDDEDFDDFDDFEDDENLEF